MFETHHAARRERPCCTRQTGRRLSVRGKELEGRGSFRRTDDRLSSCVGVQKNAGRGGELRRGGQVLLNNRGAKNIESSALDPCHRRGGRGRHAVGRPEQRGKFAERIGSRASGSRDRLLALVSRQTPTVEVVDSRVPEVAWHDRLTRPRR